MSARSSAATYTLDAGTTAFDTGEFSNAVKMDNSSIGGAFFTVGAVGPFSQSMTAGAGFIALACLIFGKWTPRGAIAAALFFGFANNLQGYLSIIGVSIPSEFLLMIPYLATILAVSGLVGRVRAPAAGGIPYSRGDK